MTTPRTAIFDYNNEGIAEGDVTLDQHSTIYRMYLNEGMLTAFYKPTLAGKFFHDSGFDIARKCITAGDPSSDSTLHELSHKSTDDMQALHGHLCKVGNDNTQVPLDLEDIECFVKELKIAEQANGLCQDGQTQCLISDADTKRLVPSFQAPDRTSPLLENLAHVSKSFIHAFLHTLVDHYLIPYLITQRHYNHQKTLYAKAVLHTAITLCIAPTWLTLGLSAIISQAFKPALLKIGFDKIIIDKIITITSAMAATFQSPTMMLPSGLIAARGREAALALVRRLPKLKLEDEPAPTENTQATTSAKLITNNR